MMEKEGVVMEKSQIEGFKTMFLNILGAEFVTENVLTEIIGGDEIDTFTQEKQQQMDLRLKSRNSVYLKKVKYALDKIQAGQFGECEDCGAEIGLSRLSARPTATLCIHCKEEEERGEKQMIHGNRHSVKFAGSNVFAINSGGRLGGKEDQTGNLSVKMGEPELDPTAG
ncbi:MAG: TraR/DksA family transcriptional regulator [Bacteriovoracia bacterium]